MAHAIAAFYGDPQNLADILHIFHPAESRLQRIQGRGDTRGRIIHLMRDHTYHFLIRFLLGLEHLLGQRLYQIKLVVKAPVHE